MSSPHKTGTTQAQLFRDSYDELTSAHSNSNSHASKPSSKNNNNNEKHPPPLLEIYGLSTDTPKANASFKAKHNLPFTLLCDPAGALVRALGMGNVDPKKKTARRGVVVIGRKDGGEDGEAEVKKESKGAPLETLGAVRLFLSGEKDE